MRYARYYTHHGMLIPERPIEPADCWEEPVREEYAEEEEEENDEE